MSAVLKGQPRNKTEKDNKKGKEKQHSPLFSKIKLNESSCSFITFP
jgi:hypothetical protein